MTDYVVTRGQVKTACDNQDWDLLDKLLELDPSHVKDRRLYTDTWGIWWGLLMEAIRVGSVDGVALLLKHGADRNDSTWGDGIEESALEAAAGHPEILALLQSPERPGWVRRSEPALPAGLTADEKAVNRQGEIAERTGLVFQMDAVKRDE